MAADALICCTVGLVASMAPRLTDYRTEGKAASLSASADERVGRHGGGKGNAGEEQEGFVSLVGRPLSCSARHPLC